MARLRGHCYDCRSGYRSSAEHRTSAKHRATVHARSGDTTGPTQDRSDEFAVRMRMSRRRDDGTPEQNGLAAARLAGLYGTVIVEDDPTAEDGEYQEIRDAILAPEKIEIVLSRRTAEAPTLAPCERCGRTGWKSAAGRAWHVANNPECATWRKPGKHHYETVAA